MADIESTYPEIFAIARRWRAAGGTVRLLCIYDAAGKIVAGNNLPADMREPGPIPPVRCDVASHPAPRRQAR